MVAGTKTRIERDSIGDLAGPFEPWVRPEAMVRPGARGML